MKALLLVVILSVPLLVAAQDDLLKELEQSQKPEVEFIEQTFKGTRLINGQTVETKGQGELEFIFQHRFGPMSGGLYELFGLDQAYVRYGLEYGLTDQLGVGIGRNSFDKTIDGYTRYKILRQSKGARVMPITLTLFAQAAAKLSPKAEDDPNMNPTNRMSYTVQALMARKFNQSVSFMLMPTFNHRNLVDKTEDYNDTYAIGAGGRVKVSRSVAITAEYYYRLNEHVDNPTYNPLGFGVDIETGGHVFQLLITNSRGLTERAYLTETTGNFFAGDISLGFNITRTFQIAKRK